MSKRCVNRAAPSKKTIHPSPKIVLVPVLASAAPLTCRSVAYDATTTTRPRPPPLLWLPACPARSAVAGAEARADARRAARAAGPPTSATGRPSAEPAPLPPPPSSSPLLSLSSSSLRPVGSQEAPCFKSPRPTRAGAACGRSTSKRQNAAASEHQWPTRVDGHTTRHRRGRRESPAA